MEKVTLTIDGQSVECPIGSTVLEAADAAGLYIPRMCHHPDLGPVSEMTWAEGVYQVDNKISGDNSGENIGDDAHCGLCLVEIDEQAVRSCVTQIENGLVVNTKTDAVLKGRQKALSRLLADHPHACLTCAQKEGCSRTDCSTNVPVDERCCILLGRCELEKVSDFISIPGDTPRYVPQHRARTVDDPLYDRDYNLCISCLRCVRVCEKVQGIDILGAVWKDDRSWVGTLAGSSLKDARCRFCGACVEVCPTGALLDKEGVEPVRCDADLPCVAHCSAGIDIPRYVAAIAAGQDREALSVIRSRVPFPGILGYVCFHPCEDACRRGGVDQPVAICDLKRFVADTVPDAYADSVQKQPETGKKVAIIGSGPAGATAAFYLAIAGHQVDLLDRESEPGGMLRYGIPDYRLPPEVLKREMSILEALGVCYHMEHRFTGNNWIKGLKAQGFDAILVAIGTSAGKSLPIEGSELEGVYPALEFLKSAKITQTPRLKGQVVVIGGGNVAIDAAMTAVRLGADDVHMVCLESRDEMPAHDWEITQAEEEGIEIHNSWGPMRFASTDGRLSGVELKKCTGVSDSQGRFAPQYDETDVKLIPTDSVVVAIGQQAELEFLQQCDGLSTGPGNVLKVDDELSVGVEGLFAAGDVTRGPSSVVDAIADGHHAAEAIDRYLGGNGLVEISASEGTAKMPELDISSDLFKMPRRSGALADPQERTSGFTIIATTLTEPDARAEAQRCLRCYMRQQISPVILPPERWQPLTRDAVDSVPETEGVFQLLNGEKKAIRIAGTMNVRQSLLECLDDPGEAAWFIFEEDPMFTKRESELIQQHLQKYGELPGGGSGGDDLDDLF